MLTKQQQQNVFLAVTGLQFSDLIWLDFFMEIIFNSTSELFAYLSLQVLTAVSQDTFIQKTNQAQLLVFLSIANACHVKHTHYFWPRQV